ncbi:MAG: site-specific DNA-methyltransferase [Kiritimatiellia bacterium]
MPTIDFKGKQFVYSHHLSVPFRELTVAPKKSLPEKGKKPSLDDNLIIHGDNLEALKALLPTHAGKVDCIFIDPPYNTGNEGWCYNDNVRSPLMKEWLKKSANPVDKEDLERHDKWLCMMWPRLQLLRELLAEDGLIFVTLDDNEIHRFRVTLDEIFGESNFVANVAWQKRYTRSNNARMFYSIKDNVLIYRKNECVNLIKEGRTEKADGNYANPDNAQRGPWMTSSYVNPATKKERPNLVYPIKNPFTGIDVEHPTHAWKYKVEENARHIAENRLWWGQNGEAEYPRLKLFLEDANLMVPMDYWSYEEAGSSDDGGNTVKDIFGSAVFDNPKPVALIEKVMALIPKSNALILDSFAGSGTTAHAVLAANAKDSGNRRFILIECEDYADSLTAERVRRVINGYKFQGNQCEELYREKITWGNFSKKSKAILEKVDSIERLEGAAYDSVKKEIKDGMLTVTGERKIEEKVPGLGGSFTFCELGAPIAIESLLTGQDMPGFEALARYVFYTATGQSLEKVPKPSAAGFIGESGLFRVHLIYKADKEWLRSNEAALNAERVELIAKENKAGKRAVVFAVAKFMSQKELTARRIEFCQLPYAIHRILGD